MEKGKSRALKINPSVDNTRDCDCCEKLLVDSGGLAAACFYLTAHGILCGECFDMFFEEDIALLYIYLTGCDVTDTAWYLGQDYRYFLRRA